MNYTRLTLQFFKPNNYNKFTKIVRNCSNFNTVSVDNDNLLLKVDQNIEQYPLVWLRDNCTCPECFHQSSFSRILDWGKFNIDVAVSQVQTSKSNDSIVIKWNDKHESVFSFKWLIERRFAGDNQKATQNDSAYRPSKILWNGNDFFKIAKKYDYNDIMNSDKTLYNWIKDLATYGMVFLENASLDNKANRRFAERAAVVRKTHYDDEFRVTAIINANNAAYLASPLQLHTDFPYYEYVPGAVNLHCITQAKGNGGESLLSDGFYVAEKLRKEQKDVFHLLSTVKVNWSDVGVDDKGMKFRSDFRSPMISLDPYGNIEKIRHSVPQRDSYFDVDISVVKPWYQALQIFVDMLNKHSIKFMLNPGEMIAFDNTRLVHGREGYEDTDSHKRCIIGICMDWDELYSKLNVLEDTVQH